MHTEIWTPYLKVISVYTAHRHKENVPLVYEHYKSNESDDKQIFILFGIKKTTCSWKSISIMCRRQLSLTAQSDGQTGCADNAVETDAWFFEIAMKKIAYRKLLDRYIFLFSLFCSISLRIT